MVATTTVLRSAQELKPFEGESLRELLAGGERPDRAKLIAWGAQLLEILAEAHAEGILLGPLTEDEVIVTPEGDLSLFCDWLPPGQPGGQPYAAQDDLYAVGCLLRRLAFAASLPAGGRRLGARDPLVKVLARATFANPAARYSSAAEMAEALCEAGKAAPGPGPRRLEERRVSAQVAAFPGVPRPVARPQKKKEDGNLWCAMVLLVVSLLLASFALATGWYILERGRSSWPAPASSVFHGPRPGPPAVSSR